MSSVLFDESIFFLKKYEGCSAGRSLSHHAMCLIHTIDVTETCCEALFLRPLDIVVK